MKKYFTLLLCALLLSQTIACAAETTETTAAADTTPTETETVRETTELDARMALADDLPDKKFDGQEFRILTQEIKNFQFVAEEMTGDVLSDSIYNRNLKIEERFDAKISSLVVEAPQNQVCTQVQAGDDLCEIVEHHQYVSHHPISQGVYLNWLDMPIIDQTKPWWNKLSNDGATINGKLFCIVGDLSVTSLLYTFAEFFNMDLLADFGHTSEELYGIVKEGGWTLDKFTEITKDIYRDTDGNGEKSVGDLYGYGFWQYHGTDTWVTALGEHLTAYNPDTNTITVEIGTEKVFTALEKIINHLVTSNGAYHYMTEPEGMAENVAGHVGIMQLMFESAFMELRDIDYAYGILPYPKYDESQTDYYTVSMDQFSVFGIPKTLPAERYEFMAILMEALNAESYKTVYPAYYDTALKGKYSEDRETAHIIDLIMSGRRCEFAFQFGNYLMNLPYMFREQIYNKDINLASRLQKSDKAIQNKISGMMKYFE